MIFQCPGALKPLGDTNLGRQPCLLVKSVQSRYTSSMEFTTSRNVNDLPAPERQTLEAILGQQLSSEQRVFIMTYTPNAGPEESARQAARAGLQRTFDKVDRYAAEHEVTPEEAEAAIEESMRHVRPCDL